MLSTIRTITMTEQCHTLASTFFFFFSTMILAVGGWLNSDLLFSNSWAGLLEILTPSLACLESAYLNLQVISILNFTFSFLWAAIWQCLQNNSSQQEHFLSDMNITKWCNGFYIEFRQNVAKETFSYDEHLKS